MSDRLKKLSFFVISLLIFFIAKGLTVQACTLWAAAGEYIQDGGVLIAKNHDKESNQPDEMRLIIPKNGFSYLGLFPVKEKKLHNIVAGINERGLVVINATASTVPHKERNTGTEDTHEKILTSFESVDTVLENQSIFAKSHPTFYMIADKLKIAVIEIGPRGEIAVRVAGKGILFHTNHYIDEKLLNAYKKVDESSEIRLNRIQYLFTTHPSPLTMEDFIVFSEDRNDAPDNSIWRTDSTSKKERTMASWIVYIPKDGSPELYVKLTHPKKPEKTYSLKLDTSFWTEGLE